MKTALRFLLASVLVFALGAVIFSKPQEENEISSSEIEVTYLSTMNE